MDHTFEVQPLPPTTDFELRFRIKFIDVARTKVGHDFNVVGDAKQSAQVLGAKDRNPANTYAFGTGRQPKVLNCADRRSMLLLWVRPRTTFPPRVRSQVTQMFKGEVRIPSSFRDR